MTSRQLYEAILIELHKENAPNLILEDFNYLANKAINQYINKRYNIYDVNQQTTDDLRVLKATAILTPQRSTDYDDLSLVKNKMATYYVDLPPDYLHILNCICVYNVRKTYKCYNLGDTWRCAATRLTADAYSQVLDNFWLKPSYKRPYYYIHNINTVSGTDKPEERTLNPIVTSGESSSTTYYDVNDIPTEIPAKTPSGQTIPTVGSIVKYPAGYKKYLSVAFVASASFERTGAYEILATCAKVTVPRGGLIDVNSFNWDAIDPSPEIILDDSWFVEPHINSGESSIITSGVDYIGEDTLPKAIKIGQKQFNSVERSAYVRYGNVSKVRLEIRYGTDSSVFSLDGGKIYIDYIKAPLHIRLTQEELDHTEDFSQMLEFPDYVCQEIINELVHIVMENISDQRLLTHPVVNLSIANPTQALAPEAAGSNRSANT